MMKTMVKCPHQKCRAEFAPRAARGGKLKCPGCGKSFLTRDCKFFMKEVEEDQPQDLPGSPRAGKLTQAIQDHDLSHLRPWDAECLKFIKAKMMLEFAQIDWAMKAYGSDSHDYDGCLLLFLIDLQLLEIDQADGVLLAVKRRAKAQGLEGEFAFIGGTVASHIEATATPDRIPLLQRLPLRGIAVVLVLGGLGYGFVMVREGLGKTLRSTLLAGAKKAGLGALAKEAPKLAVLDESGKPVKGKLPKTVTIKELKRVLAKRDKKAKQAALILMGRLGTEDPESVPELGKFFVEFDDEVIRKEILRTIGRFAKGDKRAVKMLGEALRNKSIGIKRTAAYELSKCDPAEAAKAGAMLVKTLQAPDPLDRKEAALAIGRLKEEPEGGMAALLEQVEDQDPSARAAATLALGAHDSEPKRRLTVLLKTLSDENPEVRGAAASGLGSLGQAGDGVVDRLIERVDDRDEAPAVHRASSRALAALAQRDPKVVGHMMEKLGSSKAAVRRRAALDLGELGPVAAPAVKGLAAMLVDKSRSVQRAAAQALGQVGESAIEEVLDRLESENASEQMLAARALGNMGEHALPAVPELLERLDGVDKGFVELAVHILSSVGAQAAPHLAAVIRDRESSAKKRSRAIEAVVGLGAGARAAVAALVDVLEDQDARVAHDTFLALLSLAPKVEGEMGLLIEAVPTHRGKTREKLFAVIQRRGSEAVGALSDHLGHQSAAVRVAAAEALGRLGTKSLPARAALEKASADQDATVQEAAKKALGMIGS